MVRLLPSPLRRLPVPLVLAAIGVCGGFALPLAAKSPQSGAEAPGATGQGAASGHDITVTGGHPLTIGAPCARDAAGHAVGECATKVLRDAAKAAQHAASVDPALAVPDARSADTMVGVGSLTGSSQRLGVDLRHRDTLPVRRPPPPLKPPFPRR